MFEIKHPSGETQKFKIFYKPNNWNIFSKKNPKNKTIRAFMKIQNEYWDSLIVYDIYDVFILKKIIRLKKHFNFYLINKITWEIRLF